MRYIFANGNLRQFWLAPALLGVVLIALGILLLAKPELVAYIMAYLGAAILIIAGVSLITTAWRLRSNISYHRVDEHWRVEDSHRQPPGE